MSKLSELHLTLIGLLTSQTSDLQKILDGDKSYSDLTIGEKSNATQRKKDNSQALLLLEKLKEEGRKATDAEKEILKKYTGSGGLGLDGSEDEYYTPDYIAEGAWGMFGELEEDAVILDPSAGMGIFARTRPEDIDFKQIELSKKSAELNQSVTEADMLHGAFEKRSYDFKDNSLDGIVTNVPFAEIGSDGLSDTAPQFDGIRRIEHYFLIRSMELLKYGKRGVFIVPTGILDNKSNKLQGYKKKILQMASFIGGVRLPNKIFSHTGADVAVDILVFEKHREDACKALQGGLVQYDSREAVIFDNEVNRSFIFGNYFEKPIGKKNVIGTKITSKEFTESRFLGETKYPKSAVLTEDDMDTLKVKVAKLFKQAKFKNTTQYDELILLNNVTILDKLSLTALSEMEKTVEFFNLIRTKIEEGESLTVANLKEFKTRYEQFSKIAPAGKVVKTFGGVGLYLPLMAIKYTTNDGINQTTKDMCDALIFAYKSPARVETPELEKQYKEKHSMLKIISDKAYASQFKEKAGIEDKDRVNHQISYILGNATVKLLSNWDMDANKKPEAVDYKKFQTLHDILAFKGKDNIINENGGYDYVAFTKEEIMNVDDLFLSHNGDIIPMGQIAYDGANYGKAIEYIESLEYGEGVYGLSQDEFDEKISNMKSIIDGKKKTVNINTLKLDHKSILSIAHASDADLIRGIEEEIINNMNLIYLKADNITDSKKEKIEFPTSIGIVQFYAKGYDDNFRALWNSYEEDIKKALGVSEYREAMGVISMAHSRVFQNGEKQYYLGETVFQKIKPIILKDIRKKRQEFDIKLETQVKLNPVVTAKIKAKLERDSTLRAGGEADHERLDYLGKYVHGAILDTNHGYQNEDIRHFSTSMKGTIAQDTGLGKSRTIFMSALSAVVTNRAKNALVVVPTAVYDKWVMEIRDGRKDENGNVSSHPIINEAGAELVMFTQSTTAQKDWAKFCKDSTKRIMVMPHSVFETFKFTEETHRWVVGTTKQEMREGVEVTETVQGRIPDFTGRDVNHMIKSPARTIGFFEDGNIEFVVLDEGQMAKNSSSGGASVKFASSILSSRYGVCVRVAQALVSKRHGMTGQGLVIATATPFTSSPYEIYTMLKNTGGMDLVSDMKDFEDTFMEIEQRDEVMATDPDKTTQVKVFEGLKNIQLLNSMGLSQIRYRNAETESKREVNSGLEDGALKPDYEEFQFATEATEDILETRTELLDRFELFKEFKKQYNSDNVDDGITEAISSQYGYDVVNNSQHRTEVMRKGSIFSLVHGMNMLSMNKKIALDGIMEFDVSSMPEDKLEELKTKVLSQDVTYPDIEVHVDKNGEEFEKIINIKVKLSEYIEMRGLQLENDGILSVPEVSEGIAKIIIEANQDNADLFDIDEYPKYKLLLENIAKELNENAKAKQLVFSISIAGARIIEHFVRHLYKDLKLSHKVMNAVNVGKTKKQKGDKGEQDDLGALAQFQEDYNNSMVSTVLVFTTKNSTGVDFNKMTKAVHLVDIPYTPDVWHQAMGRGVRQGNKVSKVNVYQYSTNGTLDVLKLRILSEKGDWQEKLKFSEDMNSLTSVQSDGEKIIQQALAENKNAGVEDIDRIINEKKSQREAIIAEEQKQRSDAIKEAVNNANSLNEIMEIGDTRKIEKYIKVVDEIKLQERSVDLKESTGANVTKNIKTKSYEAIQYYLADKMINSDFIHELKESENPQKIIKAKLDEFMFTSESIGGYDHRYLTKLLKSIEYDRTKTWYEIDKRGYYGSKTVTSDPEIVDRYKHDENVKVSEFKLLTDKQYLEVQNAIENNIRRAKEDITTKLLSLTMAKSIMNDAVSQALEVVPEEDKELYRGLSNGSSIFAYTTGNRGRKEIVKVEDTIKIYKKGYNEFIELPNNKMLEDRYSMGVEEKTSQFDYIMTVTKTSSYGNRLNSYHEKLENLKGQLDAHKPTIEKYFNTDASDPVLNTQTLKGIRTIAEYLQIVELTKTLEDFSGFEYWFTRMDSNKLADLFVNVKNEIVTAEGETIAKIDGKLFSTTSRSSSSMFQNIQERGAIDESYSCYESSTYIEEDRDIVSGYNFKLIESIIGKKKEELIDYVMDNDMNFKVYGNVLAPRYSIVRDYEAYIDRKNRMNDLKEDAENATPAQLAGKDIETLKIYFMQASQRERIEFMQEVKAGRINELSKYKRIIEEVNSDEYFMKAGRDGKVGFMITPTMELMFYGRRPNNHYKDLIPNGYTSGVGLKYSKFGKSGYNMEDGEIESVEHSWTVSVDNKILDYTK